MGYYSAIEEKEMLPFATTWMDLENITLSENKPKKNKSSVISFL